jgi:hypothetical protein
MTDTKRILSWEDDGNESYAGTDIGEYQIYFDFEFGWGATFDNDCILDFPNGENSLDVAKSVCEADYVARCTEFLSLYDPKTHVVVSRGEIKAIYDDNCGECGIGRRKNPPCGGCCMKPIRAALEVGK